jgi:hypothetical protein
MIAAISGAGRLYRILVNNTALCSAPHEYGRFRDCHSKMGYNSDGAFFNGFMAEIIIGNAVPSAGDIANIRSYFNTKFGTSF